MDTHVARSPSKESVQTRLGQHALSSSSSSTSRKGRSSDPEVTIAGNVDRASISLPPPASKSITRQYSYVTQQKQSTATSPSQLSQSKSADEANTSDDTTPTLEGDKGNRQQHQTPPLMLPEAALRQSKPHDPETESNRLSFSSLYSLGSAIVDRARGVGVSGPSSAAGSDHELIPESHGQGTTTAASSVSVTTSSQNSSLGLSPRTEHHDRGHPITDAGSYGATLLPPSSPKASHRVPAGSIPRPREPQPVTRSRSRTRTPRRISGSTAAASSSPGSERSTARNGKEERRKPSVGVIGVCALDNKARSKPSRNILNRLLTKGEFDVVIFGDKIILDEEVENWPVCDFLISFFSQGFPLDKAIAYARLRKPFCVNDLPMQTVLWDRRMCLMILDSHSVPTPKRLEVSRDGGPTFSSPELAQHVYEFTGIKLPGPSDGTGGGKQPPKRVELSEDADVLRVDGKELYKPFVEKPVNGEDHNIRIYYSKNMGGGGRRLFRKVNNKSSEMDETLSVPRSITDPHGSYIYEQFLQVEHAEDVKAYTVGPTYCHAETRKSPVVDGIVKRNPQGKEIRYVAHLSKEELDIASRVVRAFGQTVCGFDLLRANGKSYVIDVNGWSFVKDNNEYYDNCARILRELFIREKQRKEGKSPSSESEDQRQESNKQQRKEHGGGHRTTLKTIFQSPSMTKLAQHAKGHIHRHGTATPDTIPISSPPSIERSAPTSIPGVSISQPFLPPATMSDAKSPDVSIESKQTSPLPAPASRAQWKLKGIVSVVRHADRTPKQKFKFTFHSKPFVELLHGHQEEVLLIGEAVLKSVLDAVEEAMKEGTEDSEKLKLLRTTLIKKSSFAGTKVQIKPLFRQRRTSLDPDKLEEQVITTKPEVQEPPDITSTNAEDGSANDWLSKRSDSMAGVTVSRVAAEEHNLGLDKLQLIIKWGGEPTHSARYQAQDLGDNLRNDLWLMNRDILDDVSVFSSSERRSTTSAQIFASAFLDRQDLPADFIIIRKDLLDDSNAAKDEMDRVKKKLKQLIREGGAAPPQFAWPDDTPEPSVVVRQVVELMKFHRKVMRENYVKLRTGAAVSLNNIINPQTAESSPSSASNEAAAMSAIQPRWCSGEDADLFRERWEKLFKEFCDTEKVDPSKISELYDTMKFDALHNRQFLEWVFTPDASMLEEQSVGESQLPVTPSEKLTPSSSRRPSASEDVPRIPHSHTDTQLVENQPSSSSKEKNILPHRLPFRRKSENNSHGLLLKSLPKSHPIEPTPETYFNLYTGTGHSRVKLDARLSKLREMYKLSKILFDYIGPQEYGITPDEKLEIGLLTSLPLLKEIVTDLEEVQASEGAKSFFYFTKESHIYTLLNCILEGGIKTKIERKNIPELDYLSQINFELYESQNSTMEGEEESFNYSIRISISPGCHTFDPLDVQLDSKHCISCAPRRSLTNHEEWTKVLETLRAKFHTVKLPKSFTAINLSEKLPQDFGGKIDD